MYFRHMTKSQTTTKTSPIYHYESEFDAEAYANRPKMTNDVYYLDSIFHQLAKAFCLLAAQSLQTDSPMTAAEIRAGLALIIKRWQFIKFCIEQYYTCTGPFSARQPGKKDYFTNPAWHYTEFSISIEAIRSSLPATRNGASNQIRMDGKHLGRALKGLGERGVINVTRPKKGASDMRLSYDLSPLEEVSTDEIEDDQLDLVLALFANGEIEPSPKEIQIMVALTFGDRDRLDGSKTNPSESVAREHDVDGSGLTMGELLDLTKVDRSVLKQFILDRHPYVKFVDAPKIGYRKNVPTFKVELQELSVHDRAAIKASNGYLLGQELSQALGIK